MKLNALILNCALKKSPEHSNTQGLVEMVGRHFDDLGGYENLRPVDYERTAPIAPRRRRHSTSPPSAVLSPQTPTPTGLVMGGPGRRFFEAGSKDHRYTRSLDLDNVVHLARILKEHPIPLQGNTVRGWQPEDCSGHDDRMPGGPVG